MLRVLLCTILMGCSPFDTTREVPERGTLGFEISRLLCKRIAYQDDLNDGGRTDVSGASANELCGGMEIPTEGSARLVAFQTERGKLEASINTVVPDSFRGEMQELLASDEMAEIYKSGLMESTVSGLRRVLLSVAESDDAKRTLLQLWNRDGYALEGGFRAATLALTDYPMAAQATRTMIGELVLGGRAESAFDSVLNALGVEMRNFSSWGDSILLEEILRQRDQFPDGTPIYVVKTDRRGMAVPAKSGSGFVGPFVDENDDGLADVDGNEALFVDSYGNALDVPPPFSSESIASDAYGRTLHGSGALLYEYENVNQTFIHALVRQAPLLLEANRRPLWKLFTGARALMGERRQRTRVYPNGEELEYLGFGNEFSPLRDIAFALAHVGSADYLDHGVELFRILFLNHEDAMAQLFQAALTTIEEVQNETVSVNVNGPVWDELAPILARIADKPLLVRDLLFALDDPSTADILDEIAKQMKYRDEIRFGASQQVIGNYSKLVVRSSTDSGLNRSIFQRILYLVHDANGKSMCNKQNGRVTDPLGLGIGVKVYDECELLEIDDVSVLFLRSIAYARDSDGDFLYRNGRPLPAAFLDFQWNSFLIETLVGDNMIEQMSGIDGFTSHPTPEALSRLLLMDELPEFVEELMDPVATDHGVLFRDLHRSSLQAWELNGFYEKMQPLVQPFVDYGAEEDLIELISVLHRHWPTENSADHTGEPGRQGSAYLSGFSKLEPMLVRIFEQGHLQQAMVQALPALNQRRIYGNTAGYILGNLARHLLVPKNGLRNRLNGANSVTVGGQQIPVLSIAQMIADGVHASEEVIHEGIGSLGTAAIEILQIVGSAEKVNGQWRFKNRDTAGIFLTLFTMGKRVLEEHVSDRDVWAAGLPRRLDDALDSPLAAGAFDLGFALGRSETIHGTIQQFVHYLAYDSTAKRRMVTALALTTKHLSHINASSLARIVGESLSADTGWVKGQLALLRGMYRGDNDDIPAQFMHYLLSPMEVGGGSALASLFEVIGSVNRPASRAGTDVPMTTQDLGIVLKNVADFLDDERHGFPKFVAIVKGR